MTDPIAVASVFLMHTGSRHLNFELTNAQKEMLAHPVSKFIIMLAMFYIGTRSMLWSFMLITLYFVTVNVLLNENHAFNVFSPSWLVSKGFVERSAHEPKHTEMYLQNLRLLKQ
jgi:hypothetical protein